VKSITYLFLFLTLSFSARAQEKVSVTATEPEESSIAETESVARPETYAIQNRPYVLTKEFGLYYSYMPLDHFNHFHTFGANFLTYFNDYIAWEVFNAATVTNQSTGLGERLLADYNAIPDTFDILSYYYTTSFVYTPIYMKHLYQNEEIKFGDISFVGGAGVARFEAAGNVNMIEAGIISRFVGGPGFNFKFDVRYKMFTKAELRPNLSIGLVLNYNFSDDQPKRASSDEE
jgi:hypothetical protein